MDLFLRFILGLRIGSVLLVKNKGGNVCVLGPPLHHSREAPMTCGGLPLVNLEANGVPLVGKGC